MGAGHLDAQMGRAGAAQGETTRERVGLERREDQRLRPVRSEPPGER